MGDFEKAILLISSSVLWVGLAGLAFLGLIAVSRFQIRIVSHVSQQARRLGLASLAVAGLLTGVFALHGGSKNTNSVPPRAGTTLRVTGTAGASTNGLDRTGNSSQTITDEDIANGWRVVSMSTNALPQSVFAMPTSAVVWEEPLRRGALRDRWLVPMGTWLFPFGDTVWTNGFLFTDQGFRGNLQDRANRIVLLGDEPLGLCPFANWSCWGLSASRAWCVTNGTRGATFAFENAAMGDDPAKIVSAQLELVPDECEVRLRYDLSHVGTNTYSAGVVERGTNTYTTVGSNVTEVVLRRVLADDWDADGLANALDPNPLVAEPGDNWNQSVKWGCLTFPSFADEINRIGLRHWQDARLDTGTNCCQVGFMPKSYNGMVPSIFRFGDEDVMADGRSELSFLIDYGERVHFTIPANMFDRCFVRHPRGSAQIWNGTLSVSTYPLEFEHDGVTFHFDSPQTGWVCRRATVELLPDSLGHFFPGTSCSVTAMVYDCSSNAVLNGTWFGGNGITFDDDHAWVTRAFWNASTPTVWATNLITHIADFKGGYSITNSYFVTVGETNVPPLQFSLSCPDILFLNEASFDAWANEWTAASNRIERVRNVCISLQGEIGLTGVVHVVSRGSARPEVIWTDPAVDETYHVTSTTDIPIAVTDGVTYTGKINLKISSSKTGIGEISVSLSLTNGSVRTVTQSIRTIEPLRKLVTTERTSDGGLVNPTCLVWGTNAVLRVGVNPDGIFSDNEVTWSVVSGPGRLVSTNGMTAVVEATATTGKVTIEARFSDDEIQPRFVLPVVSPRVIPLKFFLVTPPDSMMDDSWREDELRHMIREVNTIYSQVGISFEISAVTNLTDRTDCWDLTAECVATNLLGQTVKILSSQALGLVNAYSAGDCVEIYCVGSFVDLENVLALWSSRGILLRKSATANTLAHELGHALGLDDCYWYRSLDGDSQSQIVALSEADRPISGRAFSDGVSDWGRETKWGFYEKEDLFNVIMKKLLMYGVSSSDCVDLPGNTIRSLYSDSSDTSDAHDAAVGAGAIHKNLNDAFSK